MWNIHNNITLSDIVDTLLHGLEGGEGKNSVVNDKPIRFDTISLSIFR